MENHLYLFLDILCLMVPVLHMLFYSYILLFVFLSYQYHYKRNETWTIVQGEGVLTLDDVESQVSVGDTIEVPIGVKHRIKNTGDEELVFIEVQHGTYFGEDDIVRYEDKYERS